MSQSTTNQSAGNQPAGSSEGPAKRAIDANEAISWFREASPYINEHRGKTVVLCVPDRLFGSDLLAPLTHDLTLLSHLGVRLLISFGLRSDVDARLKSNPSFHNGRRITDDDALQVVLESAGKVRNDLEARLSMGLPNTPMAGAHLSVCSGNFITARPYGVHDGIDFQHTGSVREVQTAAIQSLLEAGHLVLLPPIGHSLTGEVFNLPAEEVAVETAAALGADKLVLFVPELPKDDEQAWVREASAEQMKTIAQDQTDESVKLTYQRAAAASELGVPRVHLLPDTDPNALLRELFTVDGAGTLITHERFETLREASIQDVGGIIELIEPLQQNGTLVQRSREQLELDIKQFTVLEREGKIVACAALFIGPNDTAAEIACLVTHPDYQGQGRAAKLLRHLTKRAKRLGAQSLSIRTTRTAHWFVEQGFTQSDVNALPANSRESYSESRNSKVFEKKLLN